MVESHEIDKQFPYRSSRLYSASREIDRLHNEIDVRLDQEGECQRSAQTPLLT